MVPEYDPAGSPAGFTVTCGREGAALEALPEAGVIVNQLPPTAVARAVQLSVPAPTFSIRRVCAGGDAPPRSARKARLAGATATPAGLADVTFRVTATATVA